jgi:hypothetical protein
LYIAHLNNNVKYTGDLRDHHPVRFAFGNVEGLASVVQGMDEVVKPGLNSYLKKSGLNTSSPYTFLGSSSCKREQGCSGANNQI